MKSRMKNVAMVMPDALQALLGFGKTAENGSVPTATIQLVQLRASQINGCSVCVDMQFSLRCSSRPKSFGLGS
jgi:alkylhydroperoxidase family enzyme